MKCGWLAGIVRLGALTASAFGTAAFAEGVAGAPAPFARAVTLAANETGVASTLCMPVS
jgi:hypothetical protein